MQPLLFVVHFTTVQVGVTYVHAPKDWMVGETCWPQFRRRVLKQSGFDQVGMRWDRSGDAAGSQWGCGGIAVGKQRGRAERKQGGCGGEGMRRGMQRECGEGWVVARCSRVQWGA